MRQFHDRGAAAVEFALVIPLLLALALGTAEFGRSFMTNASISAAARAGAREMAVHNDVGAAQAAAVAAAGGTSLGAGDVSVSGCTPGGNAVVNISYTYNSLTGFFGGPWTATGQAVMRCGG